MPEAGLANPVLVLVNMEYLLIVGLGSVRCPAGLNKELYLLLRHSHWSALCGRVARSNATYWSWMGRLEQDMWRGMWLSFVFDNVAFSD